MRNGRAGRGAAVAVAVAVTTTAVLALSVPPGRAVSARGAAPARRGGVLTDEQIVAMTPDAQAQYLAPLRTTAEALDSYGRGAGAAIFAAAGIDGNDDTVDLYVKDVTQAPAFQHAAAGAARNVDLRLVRVHAARYTLTDLDDAVSSFLAAQRHVAVRALSVNPDGSGITAEVRDGPTVRSAGTAEPSTGGVVISYKPSPPGVPKSWNDVKWRDRAPFIGGDVLTPDGVHYCTAGLPAVRRSDNQPVIVTANHCFRVGTALYTAAGPTFQYGNRLRGNYVGRVSATAPRWDAEILPAANNADENDTDRYIPLTSVAYSLAGDYVCHSGQRSASLGHPTPCGIKVTDPDITYSFNGGTVRGVEGVDVNGWGSVNGDSGAVVFAVSGRGVRQARGIVSDGGADGTPDQRRVQWTEAVDIFHQFGLKLNPVT